MCILTAYVIWVKNDTLIGWSYWVVGWPNHAAHPVRRALENSAASQVAKCQAGCRPSRLQSSKKGSCPPCHLDRDEKTPTTSSNVGRVGFIQFHNIHNFILMPGIGIKPCQWLSKPTKMAGCHIGVGGPRLPKPQPPNKIHNKKQCITPNGDPH